MAFKTAPNHLVLLQLAEQIRKIAFQCLYIIAVFVLCTVLDALMVSAILSGSNFKPVRYCYGAYTLLYEGNLFLVDLQNWRVALTVIFS